MGMDSSMPTAPPSAPPTSIATSVMVGCTFTELCMRRGLMMLPTTKPITPFATMLSTQGISPAISATTAVMTPAINGPI